MKKWVSLLLSALLAVSALAGCASENGDGSKADSSGTPAASQAQSKADSPSNQERVTLTVSIFDRGTTTAEFGSVLENKYVDWVRETFGEPNNIDVQYYAIPRT